MRNPHSADKTFSGDSNLHHSCVVVDLHHDIPEDVINRRHRGERDVLRRIWIPKLRRAGIKVQVFPIYVDSLFLPEMAMRRAFAVLDYLLDEIEQNPTEIVLARSYTDIEMAISNHKLVALLALEGAEPIDPELTVLGILHRLGLRIASLTWNRRTIFADGAGEPCANGKLTRAGIAAVRRMEELKILIDVSHLCEPSFWSLMEVASKPVIASHSNARALCDHPRNLTDAQIRAVAKTGGVVGILLHPSVIDPVNATIGRVADHIEHIAGLVGIDHVCIGSDFVRDLMLLDLTPVEDWLISKNDALNTIERLSEAVDLPNLTEELTRRKFAETDIHKVLGRNCLRVFSQVWS